LKGGANFAVLFMVGRAAWLAGNTVLADDSLREALGLIQKSIEMSPDAPEGYFLRGEINFVREQYPAALDDYRAAEVRSQPERCYAAYSENFSRVEIMVKQALCYQRLENLDAARELGRRILAIAPDHKLGHALAGLP